MRGHPGRSICREELNLVLSGIHYISIGEFYKWGSRRFNINAKSEEHKIGWVTPLLNNLLYKSDNCRWLTGNIPNPDLPPRNPLQSGNRFEENKKGNQKYQCPNNKMHINSGFEDGLFFKSTRNSSPPE